MTDDDTTIELSRRTLLGGLGGIGVASAGAALGTSAYFTDTEAFEGNSLSAGQLDLLLDYRVTYDGGPGRLEDVQAMGYPEAEPIEDEPGTYLLEEVPTNGDIPQEWGEFVSEREFCDPEWRDVLVNGDEVSPITLSDVKPGDSGCLVTSIHLCDNPAYVWMNGELVANDDGGLTEPESEVDDTGGDGEGELADHVQTRLWYDENCDCEVDGGQDGEAVDVVLVLDRSGSMSGSIGDLKDAAKELVGQLGATANVGLVSYADDDTLDQELTTNHGDVETAIDGLSAGGSTNIEGGVITAQNELETGTNARSSARKIMVVMSDGNANVDDDQSADANDDPTEEAQDAKDAGTELFTVGFGSFDTSTLEAMASDPVNAHFFPAADEQELIDAFGQIGQTIAGERVIFEGTLAELTELLASGNGIPLDGDRETAFDEVVDGAPAPGDGDGRECFATDETNCIGLEWELPTDVGNVVQSDGVTFDVGFYAEQCRHNDGAPTTQRIELGGDAARNTGFEAVSDGGYPGSGYWKDDPSQTNQDGGTYEQLYLTFDQSFGPYYVSSLAPFTIGEIQSIRYRTNTPSGETQNYFLEIYTTPDGTNDDASWYGRLLQALPGDALNRSVSPNSWVTWRTDAGTNQLTFYDHNHDYDTTDSTPGTAPNAYLGQDTGVTLADLQSTNAFDWSNHVADADSTPKNYRDEEVRALRFATGSAWEGTHEGCLDAIEITLDDGRRAVVDLEP